MAQVPEKVLAWLYNVLHDYNEPQRAYADIAQVLATFPSLGPRTEIHTFENGSSALLLTLSGTLPTTFRGATYHFPIKVWLPRSYPVESPFLYITPGKEMQVRPGQHVGVDGRIYHPYLRDWTSMWDRASTVELLGYLQQAFAREPPVTSRPPAQQSQVQAAAPMIPPKQRQGPIGAVEMPEASTPPPRPPKSSGGQDGQRDLRRDGPPLPPLPSQRPSSTYYNTTSSPQHLSPQSPGPQQAYGNGRVMSPVQVQQGPRQSLPQYQTAYERSPVSPVGHAGGFSEMPDPRRSSYAQSFPQQHAQTHRPQQLRQASGPQHNGQYSIVSHQKQPMQDLLSDPFDVALPTQVSHQGQAPPIPPNPEKEHLLQALSSTLVQQAQQKVHQSSSALAPLQAQQHALRVAYSRLEGEIAQLEALDKALASNEAILRRSIQECDRTISAAKTKKQPPIDDVFVATTLVAQQLWTTCAEEAACREAMYALQKAVDKGRINGNDFVRQMRGLGRECFLKMALARKCARGLGLDVER